MMPAVGTAVLYPAARYTDLESALIIVQDRPEAQRVQEQGVAAGPEQFDAECLVGLLLAVALDLDGDGLRRLAGDEGQRAGLGDEVAIARLGGAVHSAE